MYKQVNNENEIEKKSQRVFQSFVGSEITKNFLSYARRRRSEERSILEYVSTERLRTTQQKEEKASERIRIQFRRLTEKTRKFSLRVTVVKKSYTNAGVGI